MEEANDSLSKFKHKSVSLKDNAYCYYQQGFNIIAVKYEEKGVKVVKKPLCEWNRWHSRRQTQSEFEAQNWREADGFAIVTDFPNADGYYLGVVDYDVKGEVSEEAKAKAKGKELLEKFPITKMEKSVSVAYI